MLGRILETIGLGAAGYVLFLWNHGKSGLARIDRPGVRLALAVNIVRVFGPDPRGPSIMRHMMAIASNEHPGRVPGPAGVIGDRALGPGPSIGPIQVYRSTAKELGLWEPSPAVQAMPAGEQREAAERAEYELEARNEFKCVWRGVNVFKDKMRLVGVKGADTRPPRSPMWSSVRRYNGSGPMADEYVAKAQTFARGAWGTLDL